MNPDEAPGEPAPVPERETPRPGPTRQPPAWRGWVVFTGTLIATFLLGILGASILHRRVEAERQPVLEPIQPMETDSAKWGTNYPRQYDRYKLMSGPGQETKYGGSKQRDYLQQTPANVVLFAGYAFAKGYLQPRGHTWTINDVTGTVRISPKTPATCWTCKSPDVVRVMADIGPAKFYAPWFDALRPEIIHPIGCLDCHEPNTMRLRITRPALREAFERQGRDIEQVSHQEMRSLVCAQCHVEYYFKKEGNYLTFPWDKGTQIESIDEYYDAAKFSDWTHAISKVPMLKMQHPDFEIYSTGIHAYRNVSCADCHMPYRTEGGVKCTDHYLRSPLVNIAHSCAVCHRWGEEEIRHRVEAIQDKVFQGRTWVEDAVAKAHFDIAAAMEAGAKDDDLQNARNLVRRAQMRWDFVAANNGMGIHSPQECMRVLQAAQDLAGQARVEAARILARHGETEPIQYPDWSTKQKAMEVIAPYVDGKPPRSLRRAGQ